MVAEIVAKPKQQFMDLFMMEYAELSSLCLTAI